MKVNIEIDCSPEEARRFMGLPDLNPVHDVYLDKLKDVMSKGVTPDLVQGLMKAWTGGGTVGGADGVNMMQQMFGAFANGMAAGKTPKTPSSGKE